MPWPWIVQLIVAVVLTALAMPKMKTSNARPLGFGDIKFPTNSNSRAIPVLWGRREVEAPNIAWYGDLNARPITEKIDPGPFSSTKNVTVGYQYRLGIDFALCYGPDVEIHGMRCGENIMNFTFDDRWGTNKYLVEGKDAFAWLDFFDGSYGQPPSGYVGARVGASPSAPMAAYPGVAHVVWLGPSFVAQSGLVRKLVVVRNPDTGENDSVFQYVPVYANSGYIGDDTVLDLFVFDCARYPNTLGIPDGKHKIGFDCNPVAMIHEGIVNKEWGMGHPASLINEENFLEVADRLHAEGFGLSMIWDSEMTIRDIIREICRHIDGSLVENLTTGKLEIVLVRDDTDINDLPVFNTSNTLSVSNFTRGSWDGTVNEVVVEFSDRRQRWKENTAIAQDGGNLRMQGSVKSQTIDYHAVTDASLAAKLAWRDLRAMCIPLASCEAVFNRDAYTLSIGSGVVLDWPDLGIYRIAMRVAGIDYGTVDEGAITCTLVQDVFLFEDSIYLSPGETSWVPPTLDAEPVVEYAVQEAPYPVLFGGYGTDELGYVETYQQGRVMVSAAAPNENSVAMEVHVSNNGGETYSASGATAFSPIGWLAEDISAREITLQLTDSSGLGSALEGRFALLGEEWVYVSTVDPLTQVVTVSRGHVDTVPRQHPAGTRFLGLTPYYVMSDERADPGVDVRVRMIPRTSKAVYPLELITPVQHTMAQRAYRPYPAGRVRFGSKPPLDQYFTGSVLVTFQDRNRLYRKDQGLASYDVGFVVGELLNARFENGRAHTATVLGEGGGTLFTGTPTYDGNGSWRISVPLLDEKGVVVQSSEDPQREFARAIIPYETLITGSGHMLAYWRFTEWDINQRFADFSGNGRYLTMSGSQGFTWDYSTPGPLTEEPGNGLDILGQNPTTTAGATVNPNAGSPWMTEVDPLKFAVSFWFKTNRIAPPPGMWTNIIRLTPDTYGSRFGLIEKAGGTLELRLPKSNGTSAEVVTIAGTAFNAGEWNHLAVSVDTVGTSGSPGSSTATTWTVWLNGNVVATRSVSFSSNMIIFGTGSVVTAFSLGPSYNASVSGVSYPNVRWSGAIDEFVMYDTPLTHEIVNQMYQQGSTPGTELDLSRPGAYVDLTVNTTRDGLAAHQNVQHRAYRHGYGFAYGNYYG